VLPLERLAFGKHQFPAKLVQLCVPLSPLMLHAVNMAGRASVAKLYLQKDTAVHF